MLELAVIKGIRLIMLKAEHHQIVTGEIAGIEIHVQSYKIGDNFYCHVSNLDPGATIARAEAATLEEAEREALRKAAERLHRKTN